MSAHQENSTPRTKLSTIIVRTDYLGDAKMRALIAIHGINAAALWLPFQTCIASQGGASRELLILQGLGFGISSEATEEILNTAIKIGLFYVSGDLVFSESVDVDVANVEQKRQQWREKKRGQRSIPPTVPIVSPGTCGGVPLLSEEENEYEDEEEKENEEESRKIHAGTTPARASEEAPKDPLLADAEARLEAPNGQPWTQSNAWICAGRRPLKKFPLIFLTPQELIQALQQIRKSVPPDDVVAVFQSCEAHLRGKSQQQRDSISHFNTLVNWCLGEVIDKATKRQRGKNSGVAVAPVRVVQPAATAPPSVAESEPRVSDEKAKEFIQKLKEATRCAKSIQ